MAKRTTTAKSATPLSDKVEEVLSDEVAADKVEVITPEPDKKESEVDVLKKELSLTKQLVQELGQRRAPVMDIKRQTSEMVNRFKNQRFPGEHAYLVWDENHHDESNAVVYMSDIPHGGSIEHVRSEYNSRFKRVVTDGRDPVKFKPHILEAVA